MILEGPWFPPSFEQQYANVPYGSQMPVLTASSQGDALSKQPQYFSIFLEQLKNAQARTPTPVWTQMEQILTDSGTVILSGKAPVQQALDDASAKIDKLLGQ